jgi:hypothetical protein
MRTKHKLILIFFAVIGIACLSWFAFYAFKFLNESAERMRYLSAMSWLNAAIREELDDYYKAKGKYPPQLSDLSIPFPGDGAKPEMLNNFKYVTDGTYYETVNEIRYDGEIETYKEHVFRGQMVFTEHYVNGKLFSRNDFGEGKTIPKSKFKDGNAVSEEKYRN